MPRLKTVDTPYEEDIEEFENELTKNIDIVSDEIFYDNEYKIDEVIKTLEDKTWQGLFDRLQRYF